MDHRSSAVGNSIVEQVAENGVEQFRITLHGNRIGDGCLNRDMLFLCSEQTVVYGFANELREVEVFEMGGMFAFLIEPIERGDVFEQRVHSCALAVASFEEILPLFSREIRIGYERFEVALYA